MNRTKNILNHWKMKGNTKVFSFFFCIFNIKHTYYTMGGNILFDIDNLKLFLIISITISSITCALVQKTKGLFKSSKYLIIYSLIINMTISILFCMSFTDINIQNSLWIGLFSFIGADSIYKTLEGKISSYEEIIRKKQIQIPKENIINEEDK